MTSSTASSESRLRVAAIAETVAALAVTAWVGGNAALGAYGARILFRDLPRATAAATMTTVFHSFDGLIAVALVALAAATGARLWARGVDRRVDLVAALAQVALLAVGLAALFWVHPAIERLFHDGATLSPRFAALHRASEQLGHAEVALTALLYGSFAWGRARP